MGGGGAGERAGAALEEALALYLANARKLGILKDIEPAITSEKRYTTPLDIAAA